MIEIIEDIYDNNPEKFLRLIKQGEFGKIISFTSDTHRKPHKLDNNIFLETHGSSKDIFKSILKIITYFDEFNYEDILIEVKTIQEQETSK